MNISNEIYLFLSIVLFQMKLKGEKSGRKGPLSVATEVDTNDS